MTGLRIGPLLRHIGPTDATVWVETDTPCEVEVLGHREHTWTVAGHHYALVTVTGLTPRAAVAYDVRLDGQQVWPRPDSSLPRPTIRTLPADAEQIRLAFGSCRYANGAAVVGDAGYDDDALDCYARQLAQSPPEQWPHALLLLGDQVYADETSERTQQRIRQRRDPDDDTGPGVEVADYEEYTWLYEESWTDPHVAWLLATVPVSMIFDDHDVHDDWNTSQTWRQDMQATSWWAERITGALSSYWVYQHLGNLSPAELDELDLYQQLRTHAGDAEPLLREFASAADQEADGGKPARWSYRRDLGRTRLLMIDSRCGRILTDDERSMISDTEFNWITDQLPGDYDHLLIGTSLPWLLPRAMHDVEAWDEQLAAGRRGRRPARVAETLRRAADLEHWASFRDSFERLTSLIRDVAEGRVGPGAQGRTPATVAVLSGDVHHAYLSRAWWADDDASGPGGRDAERAPEHAAVFQLTCSPLHNSVPWPMKLAFRLAWSRAAERVVRRLLRVLGPVPEPSVSWERTAGPFFGDLLAELTIDGRRASIQVNRASRRREAAGLTPTARLELTSPTPARQPSAPSPRP
ncbi:alkaline phosphatase D family protein [Nakamurella leprariae]|uniref:Alkaline phosphatase family protein n=1 Tax=Nakamurella leprariae TaxID=2803911 RepID=A0A938Y4R5_9ACTN|nr:alkaline phosphatase D family protein [Nakamurella leprariae]MBM9466036.1 alkaline phosphatase family protein [Nakamurella leprariae]